jgi:hypothetical protein
MASGSGGMADGRLWSSGGLGFGAGAAIAYLVGLPSYFSNGGLPMEAFGYGVFMIAGGILGLIIGSLMLRPDATH